MLKETSAKRLSMIDTRKGGQDETVLHKILLHNQVLVSGADVGRG
jgi:hypothetical protein